MNAPLPLRLQAQSNARAPYANRVDPAYFRNEDAPLPFDNDWAEVWIVGLANAEVAEDYLLTSCVDLGDHAAEMARLLQEMAIAYRDKPGALGDLIGGRYFQTMKVFASIAYNNQ